MSQFDVDERQAGFQLKLLAQHWTAVDVDGLDGSSFLQKEPL